MQIDILPNNVYTVGNDRCQRGDVHMRSCKQMSVVWGVSERRVTEFCKEGMIPGAIKVGKRWQHRTERNPLSSEITGMT